MKCQTDPNNTDAAGACKNAWTNKRSLQITCNTNFPTWVGEEPFGKKSRVSQRLQQPKDTKALGTAVFDKNTEMSTKTLSMQTDFTSIVKHPPKKLTKPPRSTSATPKPSDPMLTNYSLMPLQSPRNRADEAIKAAC